MRAEVDGRQSSIFLTNDQKYVFPKKAVSTRPWERICSGEIGSEQRKEGKKRGKKIMEDNGREEKRREEKKKKERKKKRKEKKKEKKRKRKKMDLFEKVTELGCVGICFS